MIKTRKMKNFDKEAFLADVSGICWEQMFSETDDINALVNYWSSLFSLMIDKHAPITAMRVSEKYCPWIDKDLRALMKPRDQLKKAASKRKSQFLMDSYRQVRNKVFFFFFFFFFISLKLKTKNKLKFNFVEVEAKNITLSSCLHTQHHNYTNILK